MQPENNQNQGGGQGEAQPENEMAKALIEFEKPRITQTDCETLKVFVGANELLKALKNVFYGIETQEELDLVRSSLDDVELQRVMEKFFLPEIEPDDPVGTSFDHYKTGDIGGATEDNFNQVWKSKNLFIELVKTAWNRITGEISKSVDLSPRKDFAFMTARNNYIDFIAEKIRQIVMNSNRKAETQEELIARARQNSSK